jgi:hypothetical protein
VCTGRVVTTEGEPGLEDGPLGLKRIILNQVLRRVGTLQCVKMRNDSDVRARNICFVILHLNLQKQRQSCAVTFSYHNTPSQLFRLRNQTTVYPFQTFLVRMMWCLQFS